MTFPRSINRAGNINSNRRPDKKVLPPDIDERIEWKQDEIKRILYLSINNPLDAAYKFALTRLRDELHQLEAIRDGKPWRRNG